MNPYGNTKEAKAIWECLKRIYKAAKPTADIEEMVKTGETKMPDFFLAYYLKEEQQEQIINEVIKKFKLKKWQIRHVRFAVLLGSSPTSFKEVYQKNRKNYKRKLKTFLERQKHLKR